MRAPNRVAYVSLLLFSSLFVGCRSDFEGGDTQGTDDAPDCQTYCDTIAETCQGDFQQYGSTEHCETTCATLEPGTTGDEAGNTVGCRLHYALEAAEDPAGICAAAGPGGNGVCGSNCEGFCQIQNVACVDDNEQYANIQECIAECATFDAEQPYSSNVTDGDSFACRLYHLTVATSSPEVHCPHIVLDSSACT